MTSPKLSIYNKKNTASLEAVFYIDCKHNIADNIGCVFACFGGVKGSRTPGLLNAIQTRYQLRYNPELPLYNNITGEELSSVFYGVYGTIFFV